MDAQENRPRKGEIMSNEMTTTKEAQMRADFERLIDPIHLDRYQGGYREYESYFVEQQWRVHKACAESYEKKLAALKGSFAEIQHNQFTLINDYKQQISEANARNAMLVDAMKTYMHRNSTDTSNLEDAISANSEAVAAREVEKLEPLQAELDAMTECAKNHDAARAKYQLMVEQLRREVAMLRSILPNVTSDGIGFGSCWFSHERITGYSAEQLNMGGGVVRSAYMEYIRSVSGAITDTQATAEAYEREVASYEIANAASEFSDDEYREITYGAVYRKLIRMAEELKTNKVKNDRNNRSSKTQHNITS